MQDPIRFNGGINFYAYVNGNPIIYRDPNGKFVHVIVGIGIGAIGGAIGALVQGGCWDDIINGAINGGLVGGALSLLGPAAFATGGPLLQSLLNSTIGGMGNFVGQVSTGPVGNLNAGSVLGSAIGSGIGGLPSIAARGTGIYGEISASMLGMQAELGIGSIGNALGTTLNQSMGRSGSKKPCGCRK